MPVFGLLSYTSAKSKGAEKRGPIGIGVARWVVAASREGVIVTRTEDVDKLIAEYIEPNPYKPGVGHARIIGVGVSVWAFMSHFHAVGDNLMQVASDYDVSQEAAEAALCYYRRHKAHIDAEIADTAAFFTSSTDTISG